MTTIGEAIIEVRGDTSRLDRDVARGTSPGKMSKAGGVAGKALGLGFAAAAGAAVAGGAFLTNAVGKASDLSESASKVGVVFGKSAGQIVKASKGSATAMGLSEEAYLSATGGLGNLLVSLDLAPKKAANLSQEMVALAGDLASFNNVSPEEALEALQSGLTGETEPLKKFGVNMNDATLKAQALKMGLIASTKDALDPQAKALAAQALIMKQTGTAQGDFARTSDGLANQQRIAAAGFEDVKAKIGKGLLPVATKFFGFLNTTAIPALSNSGDMFDRVKDAVAPVVDKVRNVFDSFAGSEGASSSLTSLRDTFSSVFESVKGIVSSAVTIVKVLWQSFGSTLLRNARTTFSAIMQVIRGAFDIIAGIFKVISSVLTGDWRGAWDGIKQIVRGAWGVISGIVRAGWSMIRTIFSVFGTVIKGVFSRVWDGIKSVASAAWGAIKSTVQKGASGVVDFVRGIPGKIAGLAGDFLSAGKSLGSKVISGIGDGLRAAGGFISDIGSSVKGAINSALGLPVSINGPGPLPDFNIPAFARGTNFAPGGAALVGEEGPELVNLPRGSRVLTAARTRALAGSATGGARGRQGGSLRLVAGTLAADASVGLYLRDIVVEEIEGADEFDDTIRRMG